VTVRVTSERQRGVVDMGKALLLAILAGAAAIAVANAKDIKRYAKMRAM
jgi:hypothetical protein